MTDAPRKPPRLATRLSHAGRPGTGVHGFVNPPLARGSTVLWPDMATRLANCEDRYIRMLTYGITGGETHFALEDMLAEIEGGTHCQLVSSGLAAITLPLLAYLKSGDHCLIPDSVYGPTRLFCDEFMAGLGIATTYYQPTIAAPALATLIRPHTKVVYLESPGSLTFEMQDVPAVAAAARQAGAVVLMDNTWGLGSFQPFRHGVDVSIQALTKYAGGHADLLLGGITVADETHWRRIRDAAVLMGHSAGADDCWMALRGLRTLAVRLERHAASALTVAHWLAERPEVTRVLYPALPDAPGHEIWRRDYAGAASLFSVELRDGITDAATHLMVEAMELFAIGASWGGFESLILPLGGLLCRTFPNGPARGPGLRLHVGLEDPADLIADLQRGFDTL